MSISAPARATGLTPSWHVLGPFNMSSASPFESNVPCQGSVCALAFDPRDNNRFFVGASGGGVWRTTDGGGSFTPLTDQMPNMSVSAIAVDYSNSNRVLVATGDGSFNKVRSIGVWKSEDGGATWAPTGLVFSAALNAHIFKLVQHPTQAATWFAATTNGLYKTTDGGATWTLFGASTFGGAVVVRDFKFQPGNPSTLFAAVGNLTGASIPACGFWRSADGGATWSNSATGLPAASTLRTGAIATTAASASTVYFLGTDTSFTFGIAGLWRSQDGGLSFTQMAGPSATNPSKQLLVELTGPLAVAPDAANEVYVGGVYLSKSVDGGVTWTDIHSSVGVHQAPQKIVCHADFRTLEWQGTTLYAGTDGGAHRTVDRGATWSDLSGSLVVAQIFAFSQLPSDPNLIYTGEQDNGINRWDGSGWVHVVTGDGGSTVINPTTPSVGYGFGNGSLYKTSNAWSSRSPLTIAPGESAVTFAVPLLMDPTAPNTLYAAQQNLWKTTDGGATWSQASNFSSAVTAAALAPSNPATLYALTLNRHVWVSTDAGKTWTDTTANGIVLPLGMSLVRVAVSPAAPGTAYISVGEAVPGNTGSTPFSGPRVFGTTNAGGKWTDLSGSLPAVPCGGIACADGSLGGVYVGTNLGVYYRDNTMSDWVAFNAGLPNVPITDLQVHHGAHLLRAATYGRGMWETPTVEGLANPGRLINLSVLAPIAVNETMTVGTVLGGANTGGPKALLARAAGPSLAQLGVSGVLPHPSMTLNNTSVNPSTVVATNTGWGGSATLSDAFVAVGAFGYTSASSADSAIFQPNLQAGNFTVQVTDKTGGSGLTIAELYDSTPGSAFTTATPRLINVSVLKQIAAGSSITAGFVIAGTTNVRVLVRAVGPTLGLAPFGIAGVMANPKLELLNNATGQVLYVNTAWGGGATLSTAITSVGAFQLANGSTKDSALLVSLPAGQYGARVSSADGGGGTVIVEVYEVP